MKHLRAFNEDINRERELMLIAITGCSDRSKVERLLSDKIGEFEYDSKEELERLIDYNLNDSELEILFLNIFNDE